jgi:hypothetical protein
MKFIFYINVHYMISERKQFLGGIFNYISICDLEPYTTSNFSYIVAVSFIVLDGCVN